jgi:hypothetical protein
MLELFRVTRAGIGLIRTRQTISKQNLLLTLTLLLLGVAEARGATAESTTRVLVLYSYNRLVPGNIEVDRGLATMLEGSGSRPLRIFSEFLDSPEFYGEDYETLMAAYLRGKYAASPPAVIVAVADEALNFLVRRRASLFPGVPIVHAVVSTPTLQFLSPRFCELISFVVGTDERKSAHPFFAAERCNSPIVDLHAAS